MSIEKIKQLIDEFYNPEDPINSLHEIVIHAEIEKEKDQ